MIATPPKSISLLVVALLCVTCYNSGFSEADMVTTPPATTTSLATLASLYRGTTTPIEEDIVVAGRVTSSDREGNFYRTLMVEDEGVGVAVKVALDALHNNFPPGMWLTIRLEGLVLGEERGTLQIGTRPEVGSGYAVDYIPSKAALDSHLFPCNDIAPVNPLSLTSDELVPSMAGRLVCIEGLRLVSDEEEETPQTWSGNHRFCTPSSDTINCYVSPYADFSDLLIPSTEGSITAIVELANQQQNRYTLKPRYGKDLDF